MACAVLAAGCDGSGPATPAPVPNVTDSQVLGSWRSPCTTFDGVTSTQSTNDFLADGSIEITTASYLDANCVLRSFDLIRSGTYLEHTQVALPDGAVQVSLDQVFDQNSVRPRGPGAADSFGAIGACGITDWETDVAVDIGGCVNDPGQPFIGIEVPFENYTIASQDRGRLSFGDEVSFTAWNRPTTLKGTVDLIRASGASGDEFPDAFIGLWRDPSRLFEGTPVSMGYVSLGEGGRITFLDLIPEAQCIGDVTFWMFDDAFDGFRDAFGRLSLTIGLESGVLRVALTGTAQTSAFERETDLDVEDLPLCRPVSL